MLSAGMRNDTALLKALTVGWQAQVQGVAGEHACGACCGVGDHQSAAQLCGRSASSLSGLCRRVPGTDMPAWSLPFDSEGSLGSATDGDEDAVTALIYLAELLDDDEHLRKSGVGLEELAGVKSRIRDYLTRSFPGSPEVAEALLDVSEHHPTHLRVKELFETVEACKHAGAQIAGARRLRPHAQIAAAAAAAAAALRAASAARS